MLYINSFSIRPDIVQNLDQSVLMELWCRLKNNLMIGGMVRHRLLYDARKRRGIFCQGKHAVTIVITKIVSSLLNAWHIWFQTLYAEAHFQNEGPGTLVLFYMCYSHCYNLDTLTHNYQIHTIHPALAHFEKRS